jgi:hypothetical protein
MRTPLSLVLLAVPALLQSQQAPGATHSVFSGTTLALNGCVTVSLVSGPPRPGFPLGQPLPITTWTQVITPSGTPARTIVSSDASPNERRVCACPGASVGATVQVVDRWVTSSNPRNPTAEWDQVVLTLTSAAGIAPVPGCPVRELPPRQPGPLRPVKPLPG